MKKNISINISGIIFHIEEDAYEKLGAYLESINRYFSNFEESAEIIADIENRIAELFLAKLNENKQIINHEDVEDLISTMGSIKDFQAVEEPQEENKFEPEEENEWKDTYSKKLYRDEKRKILGGVCAGVAHYFKVDPLWIRLALILLTIGSWGGFIVVYLIMWVVLPANLDLTEDKKVKKLFRNPDGKVISGVAKGVATYFAIDVAVIRLLFVIFTFVGGTGLIVYIILWIMLSEAHSVTDKVQMEGDPITLSNIESNIKKSLDVKENEEENIFIKILLFPFRLIAIILKGIGSVLGPLLLFLVDFIRVAAGVFMIFIGLTIIFSLLVATGIFIGVLSTDFALMAIDNLNLPAGIILETISTFTMIAAFFVVLVPSMMSILLGVSLIVKRLIFKATIGWSILAVFIVSCIVLSANIPAMIYKFKEHGTYKASKTYQIKDKTAVLNLSEVGMDDYDVVNLKLRGHNKSEFLLEQNFKAQGSTRKVAIENAQMTTYQVVQNDSILTFDSNIQFKDDAIFRGQRLDMTMYIPYNQPFIMSENLEHIIYNTIHFYGFDVWDMGDNIWMFTEKGMQCTTCPIDEKQQDDYLQGYDRSYDFTDFTDIEVSNAFIVNLETGREFKVLAKGVDNDIDDLEVRQSGNKLYIKYKDFINTKNRDALQIRITMPELDVIELSGAVKMYLDGFDQRNMSLKLKGAAFAESNIFVEDLKIDLKGASELQLSGTGRELYAKLSGASQLYANEFEVKTAKIETSGGSSAVVNVSESLLQDATLASTIENKGSAKIIED